MAAGRWSNGLDPICAQARNAAAALARPKNGAPTRKSGDRGQQDYAKCLDYTGPGRAVQGVDELLLAV
jgi:hypothetical protein